MKFEYLCLTALFVVGVTFVVSASDPGIDTSSLPIFHVDVIIAEDDSTTDTTEEQSSESSLQDESSFDEYSFEESSLDESVEDESSIKESIDEEPIEADFVYIEKYFDPRDERCFDMPMSEEHQRYVYELCLQYDVPYTFAMAIMGAETGWDVYIGERNGYYGVGMVSIKLAKDKLAKHGIDLMTVNGGIEGAIFIMFEKLESFEDEEMAAMAYNIGTRGAINNYFNKGIYSTSYSRRVIELKQALEDAIKYNQTKENNYEQISN